MAAPADAPRRADEGDDETVDVVGVGFGPSNLGVAITLLEHNATMPPSRRVTARFVERQASFGWHRGMLLEGATMQVSYLKDLVTMRDPRSAFSFLAYLHDRDRLADFINYGRSFPTRREFHDYLEWAALRVEHDAVETGEVAVDYGEEVVTILPVSERDGSVDTLDVVVRGPGGVRHLRTRNVVLARGLVPSLPAGTRQGPRVWHNHELLPRTRALEWTEPTGFVVIGAGQSAAETVEHLHTTFRSAEVHAVFGRYGYSPADGTPFVNRIFDPGAVDDFFDAPQEVKERMLAYHANTNYSVVDAELIEDLYRTHYRERVAGSERLRFRNVSRVADVVELDDRVEVVVESLIDGSRDVITADAVVYATGYHSADPLDLLDAPLSAACPRDEAGRLDVRRDYRLEAPELADGTVVRAGIYVQGPTEHTHGITSTLLSTVAVRSGEIVRSVVERDLGPAHEPGLDGAVPPSTVGAPRPGPTANGAGNH